MPIKSQRYRALSLQGAAAVVALLCLVGIVRGGPLAEAAVPAPVTITPAADTYGNQGASSTNYGASSSVASVGGTASVAYLRFLLPTTPAGSVLQSASLRLKTTNIASAGSLGKHLVREGNNTWTESALTWANRPAVTGSTLAEFGISDINLQVSIPLDVPGMTQLTGRTVTLTISSASTDSLWFWSSNYSAVAARPALILTYANAAPSSPTSTPTPTTAAPTDPTATPPASPSESPASTDSPTSTPTVSSTPVPPITSTPTTGVQIKNLAFGDSIIEGCCGAEAGKTISEVWAAALGWSPPIMSAQGGTGYLTAGTQTGRASYADRIGGVLDANPGLDVLVIEGGGNDPSTDLVAFRTAVASTFATARAKQPTAKIYVLGPYSPNGSGYAEKRAVLADEAARAGFPFIDQIEQQWTKGRPDLLTADNFHPTTAGHAMLGRRTAGELALAGAPVIR